MTVCLKDLFCGIVDASKIGLVTSVQRVMQYVFMEALAHPAPDAEEEEGNCFILKNQLLPGLRSFCSALKGDNSRKNLSKGFLWGRLRNASVHQYKANLAFFGSGNI